MKEMVPERPRVDPAVLEFPKLEALHPADFTIKDDGVVRLNPEVARRVARLTMTSVVNLTEGSLVSWKVADAGRQ
jgi:hypothetical protein